MFYGKTYLFDGVFKKYFYLKNIFKEKLGVEQNLEIIFSIKNSFIEKMIS